MKLTTLVLAGTATLLMSDSAALAQDKTQAQNGQETGQVTVVNRLNNTIAVRPIQEGTVGANTADTSQQFKVKDGVSLEDLHAGNHITYSVTEQGGTRTITSFKRQ
ncbi:MAG TPA: hypothetical protein VKR55_10900 [Bradyrhizobium sp.]|uniref:copper-binding protein n=1 Tax=Bradyrhizobium sp. TaxID=376 RepID=UPI002D13ECBA|nr:hypothetical protein [Bradyrhizobium sp.]HLZ02644.1 hypothetical protein [Bradyrhizobium sp.]